MCEIGVSIVYKVTHPRLRHLHTLCTLTCGVKSHSCAEWGDTAIQPFEQLMTQLAKVIVLTNTAALLVAEKERYEPLTPWCMLTCAKVSYFARRVNPVALSAIAELFLMNGDMCAWLYTGSPAMHSEKITLFEPENSRLKKAGAGSYSNSFIAIRR